MKITLNILSLFCLLFLLQCSFKVNKEPTFLLSNEEIDELLETVLPVIDTSQNIHLFYIDRFNDNTAEIMLYESSAYQTEKNENILHLRSNNMNVFIYSIIPDSTNSNSQVLKNLEPLRFTPDIPLWHLLIKKRDNHLYIQTITYFISPHLPKEEGDDYYSFD